MTTDCTIQFNQSFYKQIDYCALVGPLSVILTDINMVRTENEVVKPMKPPFYERFVDVIWEQASTRCLTRSFKQFSAKYKVNYRSKFKQNL